MSRHRPRKARVRATEKFHNVMTDMGFGKQIARAMKKDFEDLANQIENEQQLEKLVRAYCGK